MEKNIEKIEVIYLKERKVLAIKEWLGILFFLLSIIVAVVFVKALSIPEVDPLLTMEHDRKVVIIILINFSVFAFSIVAGYFYNKALSKKLDRLWVEKSSLF